MWQFYVGNYHNAEEVPLTRLPSARRQSCDTRFMSPLFQAAAHAIASFPTLLCFRSSTLALCKGQGSWRCQCWERRRGVGGGGGVERWTFVMVLRSGASEAHYYANGVYVVNLSLFRFLVYRVHIISVWKPKANHFIHDWNHIIRSFSLKQLSYSDQS